MKKARKSTKRVTEPKAMARAYQELVAVGGQNSDWAVQVLGEDAQVFANQFLLRSRMRDLYDCNGYMQAYVRELCTNTFGARGMVLHSEVQEQEDRVVYAAEEKNFLLWYQRRVNRVRDRIFKKTGNLLPEFRAFDLDSRGTATVKVGEPDLYAQKLVEQGWLEWNKAKNCDARGTRPYPMLCNLRLIGASRDGGHFIRMIRDPKVNDFGFAIQQVNDEWCDYWLNQTLPNGNEIRMGIEYQRHSWGLGKPVNYYFIKRQPSDWLWSAPGTMSNLTPDTHDVIPADQVIHYANYRDADSTRPAPWGCASIPKSRQLDQYELYEVTAARVACGKTGWLYSDVAPEGGVLAAEQLPQPNKIRVKTEPGQIFGLPYGVKFQSNDPTNPNANYPNFRTSMLRGWCAALPAACFSVIGQDYSQINFSAGRLEKLTVTDAYKVIQQFDIMMAGDIIFENFLEMALMTGAIQLPFTKYRKFIPHIFQGRGWEGVDPIKEAQANALNIANKLDTRTNICARSGYDFREIVMKLSEEEDFMEEWGLNPETTALPDDSPLLSDDEKPEGEEEENPEPKKNGKKHNGRGITLKV